MKDLIVGWIQWGTNPKIVSADPKFWIRFLYRNLDRISIYLVKIPKTTSCIVCGIYSLNFTSRSSVLVHIKNHAKATVNYWLDNMISKSPEELESILYESRTNGVVEY